MWTKWKTFRKAAQLSAWLIPLAAAGSIWSKTWLWSQLFFSFFLNFFFFLIKCKDFTRCASEHLQLCKIYWYIKLRHITMLKYIGRFYKSIAATHRVKRTAINNCSQHTTLTRDKTPFIWCYFHFSLAQREGREGISTSLFFFHFSAKREDWKMMKMREEFLHQPCCILEVLFKTHHSF